MRDIAVAEPALGPAAPFSIPEALRTVEKCQIVALSPERYAEWDRYVARHADGSLFHTLAWRDAVRNGFGHTDHYWAAVRDHRIVGVFPAFLVASRIAGRMLVSVPYGVGGGILADDSEAAKGLLKTARRTACERGCSIIDLRSERATAPDLPIVDRYVGFRRELPDRAEEVLSWLPRKARAAARNARDKYGLTAHFNDENLALVWRLYTISMRRLASLNYPYRFFKALADRFRDRSWVTVVRRNGQPVAGLVTFLYRDRVMPYFIGTTDEARHCSAANFIYLAVMERAVAAGYRVFDFGRSRRDNSGSYDFKRFHGFEPRPLEYQRYIEPGRSTTDLSPANPAFSLARRIWPYLPLCVTRFAGAHLSRHIPG
jgi:FemAB-related protein (PEP-CTERM system-associated)